ncbi:MAG: L-serine ammonia-lyase, iron-sulfur-dependent, subunit alpha, partial [Clostridia bacterium]
VHGLVEIPCVYRNAGGVSQAIAAAQLALSGVPSPIPCDEMILAMKDVGDGMPAALRETGEGGCAACRSARRA